jgi:hypothetical protein
MTENDSAARRPVERRDFIRIPFRTETVVRAGNLVVRAMEGIDVSMNGLRISTEDPVPAENTPCEAQIILGSSDMDRVVIRAKGRVVRSMPGSLAIQFTEIDLDSYQHLRKLILINAEDPEKAEQEFISHWGIRPARK